MSVGRCSTTNVHFFIIQQGYETLKTRYHELFIHGHAILKIKHFDTELSKGQSIGGALVEAAAFASQLPRAMACDQVRQSFFVSVEPSGAQS